MQAGIPLVVFSNLDGIVDQPAEPGWADAANTLSRLVEERVPIVLCSSRTRAEVEAIQQRLGLDQPFVCERGAATFVPAGYFEFTIAGARDVAGYQAITLGGPATDVIGALRRIALRQQLDVVGFSEMSVEEVAQDCRLSLLDARLAKLREYGERFRLIDPGRASRERLFRAIEHGHLRCWEGDRYHDVSTSFDPLRAVDMLYALFRRSFGAIVSVGAMEAVAPFLSREPVPPPGVTLPEWAQRTSALVRRLREQRSWVTS